MACPDAIAANYGGNSDGGPLGYSNTVGGTHYWYPAKCLSVESGAGASAVVTLEAYPVAGGSFQVQHVAYSQNGVSGYWFCTELADPGGIVRG